MRNIPSYLLSTSRSPTYKVLEACEFNRSLSKLQKHASLLLDHVASRLQMKSKKLHLCLLDAGVDTQVAICSRGKEIEVYASIYWLTIASDKEIKAVFAHELGHLMLGHLDNPKSWSENMARGVIATLPILKTMFMTFFIICLVAFSTSFFVPDYHSVTLKTLAIPLSIFSFFIFLLVALSCRQMRKEEREADGVANKFGFGEDLARDLYRDWRLLSWFQRFCGFMPFSTHPPLLLRINRLKKKR